MELKRSMELNLEATVLRLGLPGIDEQEKQQQKQQSSLIVRTNKRSSLEMGSSLNDGKCKRDCIPTTKTQVVGWPPIRSYRKNVFQARKNDADCVGMYVKVSMDGAPYLRKIDLKIYKTYLELLEALENMFKCTIGVYSEREGYNGSEYAPTYEDKDGDWMLVGDVPFEMFINSCSRLRIMKGSGAKGLGCL